ncbi:MAG: 2-C-methyl-D-erythritol 2,4-cyclodiphosphate synthase [Candidatus Omnitrophica bacterium]|nr:2-C-methyl-D-erythritol 2,4-cyclodiphosphate synthase [Candidatus Omnitrophota bacterium]
MNNYRIGFGFDVHRFSAARSKKKDLILGGIKIPAKFSLEAVSDGDVILHAACDALCGCACLGDIGDYFPPESKSSKGLDSKLITAQILKRFSKKYEITNMDITIVAEQPRLAPHKQAILSSLKRIFQGCPINIKIKSKEGLDILGGARAIACLVCALAKVKPRCSR